MRKGSAEYVYFVNKGLSELLFAMAAWIAGIENSTNIHVAQVVVSHNDEFNEFEGTIFYRWHPE